MNDQHSEPRSLPKNMVARIDTEAWGRRGINFHVMCTVLAPFASSARCSLAERCVLLIAGFHHNDIDEYMFSVVPAAI
jgi:hypothetical protein